MVKVQEPWVVLQVSYPGPFLGTWADCLIAWKPNNNGPRNPETGEKFPLPNGPAKANGKRTIDEADADAESGRHKQKKTSPQPEEKKDAETYITSTFD